MSWEEMSEERISCPCGKGTYSVTHRMDDWNRTDVTMHMDCDRCGNDYVLYQESHYRSGLPHVTQFWISRQTKAEYERACEKAMSARQKANILRAQRYRSQWIALFEGKNKKQIWEILTNKGARYPALGTFYQHTKEEGLTAYLERHFDRADDSRLRQILDMLNVEDAEVTGLLDQAAIFEQEAHDLVWREKFPK